jgi:hypothetical protein
METERDRNQEEGRGKWGGGNTRQQEEGRMKRAIKLEGARQAELPYNRGGQITLSQRRHGHETNL